MSEQRYGYDETDEIDRLYARLQSVEPPADFVASVMARVGETARPAVSGTAALPSAPGQAQAVTPGAALAWIALQLLGALLVGLAAYWLGQAFWTNGAYDLLALLRDDASVLSAYGDAYLDALLETTPWLQLGAVALALMLTSLTWIHSHVILGLFADGGPRRQAR